MNHDRAKHLLPAYADRQLGPVRRYLLSRHIARCPSCLAELESIRAMGAALRTNLPIYRAPPALAVTHVSPTADPLVADVVADHVRSMMADHLTDVATSDQHTVKPWLSARLALSPEVKDFVAEGYPLVGGRLDYVEGHRAAAIVYRRDKHVINLFAFVGDDRSDEAPKLDNRDGFNVIRWRTGGLTYVAVSDVEAGQLLAFVRLVEGG